MSFHVVVNTVPFFWLSCRCAACMGREQVHIGGFHHITDERSSPSLLPARRTVLHPNRHAPRSWETAERYSISVTHRGCLDPRLVTAAVESREEELAMRVVLSQSCGPRLSPHLPAELAGKSSPSLFSMLH